MIVTDIVEYSKSKYKIYLDGEFAFVLYKGELRSFNIKKDEELTASVYKEITENTLTKRAKIRAMHLLEKRPYTEKVMRQKLSENFYSDEIIDVAIDYLKSFKYIDDYSYCIQFIDAYSSTKSLKKIKLDLMIKGVDSKTIEKAVSDKKDDNDLTDERELIRKLLVKRHYDGANADAKENAKIFNYLYNKGFSIDCIRDVLGSVTGY